MPKNGTEPQSVAPACLAELILSELMVVNAEGGTRTLTLKLSQAPQACVYANSTTSAYFKKICLPFGKFGGQVYLFRHVPTYYSRLNSDKVFLSIAFKVYFPLLVLKYLSLFLASSLL